MSRKEIGQELHGHDEVPSRREGMSALTPLCDSAEETQRPHYEATPSPDSEREQKKRTLRNSEVIDRVDSILPKPEDGSSQGHIYGDSLEASDDETPGDNDAPDKNEGKSNRGLMNLNDALVLEDVEEYRPSKLPASSIPSALTEYTSRVSTHRNIHAYECAYIEKNRSRIHDEVIENQRRIDELESRSGKAGKIVSWMKEHLDNAKVDSVYEDHPRAFIPCIKLYAIMNQETIQKALEELNEYDQIQSIRTTNKQVSQTIAPSIDVLAQADEEVSQFRRVFAVLIMIRKADCIFDFVRQKVDDGAMCDRATTFEIPEGGDKEELQKAYDKFPAPCRNEASWSRQDIRDFRDKRWEVSPPFFFVDGSKSKDPAAGAGEPSRYKPALTHYKLQSSDVILPFLKEKRDPAMNGGFSQLEFYRLHDDQHDGRRYTIHKKKHPIAVKRLEAKHQLGPPRDQEAKFQSERYVLQRLTLGSKSEHLVKLLATFETPGENCPSKYQFIFEAADGTIKNLWEHSTLWKEADKTALSRWAARQCYGLAEALAQLHKFPKAPDDHDPKTRGMHGDIKPDNILWYKDWDSSGGDGRRAEQDAGEEPLGILQIADFGLSSFHSTYTISDVKIFTTNDYTAPETECSLEYPPASDVWALGCLFLDFATWLVGGPGEYEAFTKKRTTRGLLLGERARFSTFRETKRNSLEVVLSNKVVVHAKKLYEDTKASPFVRELITLVLDRMLVMEPLKSEKRSPDMRCRIAIGNARVILRQMLDRGRSNPSYHVPSVADKAFKTPRPSILYVDATAEQQTKYVMAKRGALN